MVRTRFGKPGEVMNYLTAEQVLFLHARLIEETGGSHGVRDVALLTINQ